MKNNDLSKVIGNGAIYPITLSKNKDGSMGWYPVQGDPKLIENNLCSLVNYEIGQRFRQEDFGTRLWECIDEPNSQALEFIVEEFLKMAISQWEDRITFKNSEIAREGSKLYIRFTYVINYNNTSKSATIVYDNLNNNLTNI